MFCARRKNSARRKARPAGWLSFHRSLPWRLSPPKVADTDAEVPRWLRHPARDAATPPSALVRQAGEAQCARRTNNVASPVRSGRQIISDGKLLTPLVDERALEKYLAEHLPDGDAPLRAEKIQAGHSNETFLITRANEQWVLRRPPRGPLLPTAHDVLREYRVISALSRANFPVPRPLLACEDASVLGAPFYLMERVEGVVIRDQLPPAFDSRRDGAAITDEVIRTLVALHAIAYREIGLENLGKPEGYIARQVKRWMGQFDGARTREIPELDFVSHWLQSHQPPPQRATIVHGDYRLDNTLFAPKPPPRLRAVFDWEMSTLGDPLADLGYLLSFWREAGEPVLSPLPDDMGSITPLEGFLKRAEVAARYQELSGRQVNDLNFYMVLAIWKLAILLEGSYKRHLAGTTDDPFFARLDEGVPALARRARSLCESAL